MGRKIGIFGGTFDPPHFGHLKFALHALDFLRLDELFFIPVFISPFKTKTPPESPKHRLAMVKLLIKDYPQFKVLDIEIAKKRPSFTIDTLQFLKEKYPRDQLYLLLGEDALEHFLSWKDPEAIVEIAKLAVAKRDKRLDLSFLRERPTIQNAVEEGVIPMPLVPISSTMIRDLVAKKEIALLETFVPKSIANYITSHHLYAPLRDI